MVAINGKRLQYSTTKSTNGVGGINVVVLPSSEPMTYETASPTVAADSSFWDTSWPYFIIASTAIFVAISFVILIWCSWKYCRRKSDEERSLREGSGGGRPSATIPLPVHLIKLNTEPIFSSVETNIQPPSSLTYVQSGKYTTAVTMPSQISRPPGAPPTSISENPLGIRARRTPSQNSITLNLTQLLDRSNKNDSSAISPTQEIPNLEEFAKQRSNRLTRSQLRLFVKKPRSIQEEFIDIPMNQQHRRVVYRSAIKNRHKDIIPNEATRVKIPDYGHGNDPLNSYINANYIRGFNGRPRAYIATQGPMSHTVVDFWKMVFHERSPCIIMITKLKEDKELCENYLPGSSGGPNGAIAGSTTTFGPITVTITNVLKYDGFTVRSLSLILNKGSVFEERECTHFWFTSWYDHKVPDSPKQLLHLIKMVDNEVYNQTDGSVKGPVTVHCSAGIGRTGGFICASIGVQQLRDEHEVDLLQIVCQARLDRGGLIRTLDQYEFVYQTLCLYERELPSVR